jgi:hypothetical protein
MTTFVKLVDRNRPEMQNFLGYVADFGRRLAGTIFVFGIML